MQRWCTLHIVWLWLLISLATCTASEKQKQPIYTQKTPLPTTESSSYVYDCDNGYRFTARIEDEKAWLFLPDRTVMLPQIKAANSPKFSDGRITFRPKANLTILDTGQEVYNHCRNNRAEAIWEDAKFRGVSFRAVGNEPGWQIEITHGAHILYVGDYGITRHEFQTPAPLVDQQTGETTYRVKVTGHDVTIVLKGQRCRDTMSDEEFDAKVTVIFDGRELRGCGRALH